MAVLHVYPINDTHEHLTDEGAAGSCPCGPVLTMENGDMIWVHNSWDGREVIEELTQDIRDGNLLQ